MLFFNSNRDVEKSPATVAAALYILWFSFPDEYFQDAIKVGDFLKSYLLGQRGEPHYERSKWIQEIAKSYN